MEHALEEGLREQDLAWLRDFEVAVTVAAKQTNFSEKNVDPKIYAAIEAVLKNAAPFVTAPLQAEAKWVNRLSDLIEGGRSFLKGKTASFSSMWHQGNIDIASAKSFSQTMYKSASLPAKIHCSKLKLESINTLIDIGGGGGAWAASILKAHPQLLCTVFDLENVNKATQDILLHEHPDLAPKVSYVAGNFFKDPIPAAECYLLSNILHDWPPDLCVELLQHIRKHMPRGSRLWIHECLLGPDRSSPRFTALFNLLMLLNHGSQQFTWLELTDILKASGFSRPKIVSEAAHYSIIECLI